MTGTGVTGLRRRRRRRAAATALLVAAAALAGGVSAETPPAVALASSYSVTPATGLTPGQDVTVSWTGASTAGAVRFRIVQCAAGADPATSPICDTLAQPGIGSAGVWHVQVRERAGGNGLGSRACTRDPALPRCTVSLVRDTATGTHLEGSAPILFAPLVQPK